MDVQKAGLLFCLFLFSVFLTDYTESTVGEDCMRCKGEDYRGKISTTESGRTCQRWNSQKPHKHDFNPYNFPEKNLEENYCRNPDGDPRPWCYTTDRKKHWEYCSIPQCTTEITCTTGDGSSYRGTISVTISGKTCQNWTSQRPHKHDVTPEAYVCGGLEENYCRNPDDAVALWCYTTDPETRWEYCNVPKCEHQPKPVAEDCMHCSGEDYRGKISTTKSGYNCQSWNSQTPHQHKFIPSDFPEKNFEKNYCRNPTNSPKPWCFTTNPSKRWEFCSIPQCTSEPPTIVPEFNCITGDGSSYRGTISVTKSGKTCQKWTSQTPHKHSRTPEGHPCSGLEENYCRNPDNKRSPWCYTTDPDTQWEYCNVPSCELVGEDCMHCTGGDYRGKISTTESGYTCQRWDSQKPHQHHFRPDYYPDQNMKENYCRNPGGEEPRPWCYTTDPSKRWEYCSVPRCTTEPPKIVQQFTCITGNGGSYRGTISVTKSGKTCQKWTSQTPHTHRQTPENYPCSGLEENYCRNHGNKTMPWCYTTDPDTISDFCDVPRCEDQPKPEATEECMTCRGGDYRGKLSTTEKGYTCQHWDSQTPHQHHFDISSLHLLDLEENYCRNPDAWSEPWCYTTDPNQRWDVCTIPQCATELTCATGDGSSYRGTISVTVSGKTCQNWASQIPHSHIKDPELNICEDLEKNYCRNPNNKKAPWCFTTDPETRWEYCNVPICENQPKPKPEDCMHCIGEDYRGKLSTTESGYTCQRWDSQKPHLHDFVLSILPQKNLEENYCRNPSGGIRPWCYTTDPFKPWEYCSIPRCTSEPPTIVPELICTTGDGSSYRGTISVTKSGKTCQKWTSQTPHTHDRTPENYPCSGLEENYCRNLKNDKAPWCFTTDPETRWEYCNVPSCADQQEPKPESLKCGQPAIQPKLCSGQRIVGGCVSKPHSWPWQISIRISAMKTHWCGGTLIDPQWILTAAHCLERSENPSSYNIFLGTHTEHGSEPSKQEQDVFKLLMGPPGTDIALLKLKRPAVINDKVSLACLPEKDYIVPHGTECFATGWGETQGTGGEGYLKETSVPVIQNKICNSPSFLRDSIKEHEMCAGHTEGGTDSCQGDSGGPLVCKAQNKFVLQGVTSWGRGCALAKKPGVYVRVSKFIDWIQQSMKEN